MTMPGSALSFAPWPAQAEHSLGAVWTQSYTIAYGRSQPAAGRNRRTLEETCVSTSTSEPLAPSASPDIADAARPVFRRIAWRLLPLLTLAYIVNFLDRTNIGFAAITMNHDVGLSAAQFGYGAGVLFIGYCFFELPSNIALYRFGARAWLCRIMVSWGLISMATIFVAGPKSFYLLRFLLGVAEAGFFPGVAYFLARWFPAEFRARIY